MDDGVWARVEVVQASASIDLGLGFRVSSGFRVLGCIFNLRLEVWAPNMGP